jgi:twitching motility protein PilT
MTATSAIRNLIREGQTHQLMNSIQTGKESGMQTFNQSLTELCRRGTITLDDALARSADPEELKEIINGQKANL